MSAPVPAAVAPRPATAAAPVAPPAVIQTQSGAMVRNGGAPNLPNYTGPGGSGVLVDNGNGTSTLIAPDGRITTVPTPKQ